MKKIPLWLFCLIMAIPIIPIGYLTLDSSYRQSILFAYGVLFNLLVAIGAQKALIGTNEYYKEKKDLANTGFIGVAIFLIGAALLFCKPKDEFFWLIIFAYNSTLCLLALKPKIKKLLKKNFNH